MALSPNTQTYVDISTDLKEKLDAGELSLKDAGKYIEDTWGISKAEYNAAVTKEKAERTEYDAKVKSREDISVGSIFSRPVDTIATGMAKVGFDPQKPELMASQDRSGWWFNPQRAVNAQIRDVSKGVSQVAEDVIPDAIRKPVSDAVGSTVKYVADALNKSEYGRALTTAIQERLDPIATTADTVIGTGASLIGGTGLIAPKLVAGAKALGASPTVAKVIGWQTGFVAADLIMTDKDENISTTLVEAFPDVEPYLAKLVINPDDDQALKYVKKAVENLAMGGVVEGGVSLFQVIKGYTKTVGKARAIDKGILEPKIKPGEKVDSNSITGETRVVEVPSKTEGGVPEFEHAVTIKSDVNLLSDPEYAKKGNILSRWLGSRQGFDVKTHRAQEFKRGELESNDLLAHEKALALDRAIKDVYGVKRSEVGDEEINTIRLAIGRPPSLRESATPDIRKLLDSEKPLTKAEESTIAKFQDKLIEEGKVIQQEAFETLPDELKQAVTGIRDVIDARSKMFQELGIAGKPGSTLDKQLGFYTHIDYEIHSNPEWLKSIKKAYGGKTTDTEALLAVRDARSFIEKMNPDATADEIQGKLGAFIEQFQKDDEAVVKLFTTGTEVPRGTTIGRIFSEKTGVDPLLKGLYKEVVDPVKIAESTIVKQGRLLAEYNFAKDMKEIAGSEYGSTLFNVGSESGAATTSLKEAVTPALDLLSPNANPLKNVFTSKEYAEWIKEGLDTPQSTNTFMRTFQGIQAAESAMKTIFSISTHAVNTMGNPIIMAANGNLFTKESIEQIMKSSPAIQRKLGASPEAIQESVEVLRMLKKMGVVDTNITAEMISRGVDGALASGTTKEIGNITARGAKYATDVASKVYRAEDNIFRIASFYKELNNYKSAFKDMPEEQAQAYAAEMVKLTMPTYERLPRVLKALKSVPLVGVFPAFTAEVVRTTKNIAKIAAKDMIQGVKTNNPTLFYIGAKRMSSLAAVGVGGEMLYNANNMEHGVSTQDIQAVNKLLPDYSKNATVVALSSIEVNKATGDMEFRLANLSNNDTYDFARRAHRAAAKYVSSIGDKGFNERDFNTFMDEELANISAFTSPALGVSTLGKLFGASTTGSKSIYDPANSASENVMAAVKTIFSDFTPKTISTLYAPIEAATGSGRDKYGAPSRATDKAYNAVGLPVHTISIDKSIQFKVAKNVKEIGQANGSLKRVLSDYQTKGESFWADKQGSIDKLIDDVDNTVKKSFEKQVELAHTLNDAKHIEYFTTDSKGKREKTRIGNVKLFEILSEENLRKVDKSVPYSIVEPAISGRSVGMFVPPPLLTGPEIANLHKKGFTKEATDAINNRLGYYAKESTKLLSIKDRKSN
jgi:hypothetical protein